MAIKIIRGNGGFYTETGIGPFSTRTRAQLEARKKSCNRKPAASKPDTATSQTEQKRPADLTTPKPSEQYVDALIAGAKQRDPQRNGSLDEFKSVPSFREMVAAYRNGHAPPFLSSVQPQLMHAIAAQFTATVAEQLCLLKKRVAESRNIEREESHRKKQAYWKKEQAQLAGLLRDAADLFDSGQCDLGPYDALSLAAIKSSAGRFGDKDGDRVDEVCWCGTDNLRRWATIIERESVEVVFPKARAPRQTYTDSIGTRGLARDPTKNPVRGMVVREIAKYVPETMHNRTAVIVGLANYIGLQKVNRQYVRNAINVRRMPRKGRT